MPLAESRIAHIQCSMSDFARQPKPPEWLKDYGEDAGSWMPEFDNRTAAALVLRDLDYDSQLAAIHSALREHRVADTKLKDELAEIAEQAKRTSGIRNEHAVDAWVERVHSSVYEGAARSMAAVGMLAPLMESVFYQAFQGIRQQTHEDLGLAPGLHARWARPAEDQWDCRFVWTKGRRSGGIVRGILQLADATGLRAHLPADLKPTLEALFEYRNGMFHNGFEWPVDERSRFEKRIKDAQWPVDWFGQATTGGQPWVFYMSDSFIDHVERTIDRVIDGIGAYCKLRFFPDSSGNAHSS